MTSINVNIPFRERLSCTIPEACIATGLGRTKLYEEIAAGRVRTTKVGTRILVFVESLESLLHQNRKYVDGDQASGVAA